jgi:hypothetical protein
VGATHRHKQQTCSSPSGHPTGPASTNNAASGKIHLPVNALYAPSLSHKPQAQAAKSYAPPPHNPPPLPRACMHGLRSHPPVFLSALPAALLPQAPAHLLSGHAGHHPHWTAPLGAPAGMATTTVMVCQAHHSRAVATLALPGSNTHWRGAPPGKGRGGGMT